ncbi:hypothetical protein [Xanthobacter wiegelii]|uniref:hypothetical protein n=1 Tax=Xanthobacter wiegelii TaxID=3119913 RepID=UPI003726962D
MSEPRPLSDQFILRIKAVTRDLVKLCGGIVRSGEITHRSKSEVGRWVSVNEPDIIDLSATMALESECGVPLVTTVMAEMHGRRLTDETAAQSAASINAHHSALLRAQGELSIHMSSALEDGTITPAEAEILDRSASEFETLLRAFRGGLASVRANGPACAAKPLRVVGER